MRRLTRIELAIAIFRLEANRAKEPLSEFKAARLYIDLFFDDIVSALKSGMSQADVIHMIVIVAQCRRKIASQQLWRRLKQAGITADEDEAGSKQQSPAPSKPASAVPPAPAPKPEQEPPLAKPKIENPASQSPPLEQKTVPVIDSGEAKVDICDIAIGIGFVSAEDIQKNKERRAAIKKSSIIGSGGSLATTD